MRPIALIFAVVALLVGVALSWVIASKTISWVETGTQAELEQALYAGGIDWAEIEPDGFTIILRGRAESKAEQARAVKIARLIFGDNLIDETSSTEAAGSVEPSLPPFVEILKNGDDFSFVGRMPTGETSAIFIRYVESLGASAKVTNITEPIENEPENWLPAFEFALRLAPLADQAIINISPGAVVLEAVPMSPNWQQGFEEMAEKLRPEGVALTVNISAPRPVISPYVFILDLAAPEAAICSAQDEAEAARIFATVEQMIGLQIECDIGIGAPSRQWRAAIDAGLAALAGLGGGRLEISDADIWLTAPKGMDLADFETIAQTLRLGLPDGFSLETDANQAPPRQAAAETRPMEFTATLAADGRAIIEGSVKDTLTREVVMRFSEAKFGYGQVQDQMWLNGNLPDGWQVRVFALIEALALLNEGEARMDPGALRITGDASFENPAEELTKLLADAYTADEAEINVSYTEQMDADPDGLDPRVCVSRINKLLAENQIVFAPSSAVISDPSMPAITAIAALLTQCRNATIEIGGHTDSQGREEMNLTLSQGRADAVLDALLAQGLLLGDLTARGYGEAEPVADNSTEAGRTRNRRIEFKLLRNQHEAESETTVQPATERVVIENFRRPAMRARN